MRRNKCKLAKRTNKVLMRYEQETYKLLSIYVALIVAGAVDVCYDYYFYGTQPKVLHLGLRNITIDLAILAVAWAMFSFAIRHERFKKALNQQ